MSDIKKFNAMYRAMYLEIGSIMRGKADYYNTRIAEDASDVVATSTPLILIDVTDSMQTQMGSTLDHKENKISFTITVDITAQDYKGTHRRDVCEALRERVHEYFVNEIGMFPAGNFRNPLLEEKKHRTISRFTAIYDVDTNTIYKK